MNGLLEDGVRVMFGFFALGLLWLFIASVMLAIIDFIRRVLG